MDLPRDVPWLRAGAHLVLRPWQRDDLDLVREAAEDDYIPLITTVPAPYSDAEGVAFVHRQWGRTVDGSGYPFVIAPADGGRALGSIGLWTSQAPQGRATLGYWLVPSSRGRGAAAEALRTVSAWASGDLGIPRLQLFVEPWNIPSRRTAEEAGYVQEGLLRSWQQVGEQRRDMLLYARVGSEG